LENGSLLQSYSQRREHRLFEFPKAHGFLLRPSRNAGMAGYEDVEDGAVLHRDNP
jgi:hypothetical protein